MNSENAAGGLDGGREEGGGEDLPAGVLTADGPGRGEEASNGSSCC